jgi:competence protein ComEC
VSDGASSSQDTDKPSSTGFACTEGLCLAHHPSGAIVVHALDAQAVLDACATASVIVIDDATAKNVCRWKEVLVVTKRDLALNGSAAITLSDNIDGAASPAPAMIEYAISRPFRPWHEQRRFSREARGLPAYRRPDKPAKPTEASPASPSLEQGAASPAEAADPVAQETVQ